MVKVTLKYSTPWPSFRSLNNGRLIIDDEIVEFNKFAVSERIPALKVSLTAALVLRVKIF